MDVNEKLDLILKELEEIKIKAKIEGSVEPYQSKETKELNAAIAKASIEFPKINVNRENPYLVAGYADLNQMLPKIRPILGRNDLHLSHQKKLVDGASVLITRLWHSSGQWIESRILLKPNKNTLEAYGSHLNCMKRFEVMDMLGLTINDDPFDDDGEADMEEEHKDIDMGAKLKTKFDRKKQSFEVITKEQYEEIMKELDDEEDLTKTVLERYSLRSFREMPKNMFPLVIREIRRIKEIRKRKYNE